MSMLEEIELRLWRFRDLESHKEALGKAEGMAREILEIVTREGQ